MTYRRIDEKAFLAKLHTHLTQHKASISSDPQSNPVKLLAYDISKDVENREIEFRDIESLVKTISDDALIDRARRLHTRAGVDDIKALDRIISKIATAKAKLGYSSFKKWVEEDGLGIVFTAHPTFSLSREIRDTLGEIASSEDGSFDTHTEHLKTLPYLSDRGPTLQEEHFDTQATIARIQVELDGINAKILDVARKAFPEKWTQITPNLVNLYSWVGYDIDGRTDIGWGDALRLRLQEKAGQISRYLNATQTIEHAAKNNMDAPAKSALGKLIAKLEAAHESAVRDLELFNEDLTDMDNLVAAANNLTRSSTRRLLNLQSAYPLIKKAIKGSGKTAVTKDLICLRAGHMACIDAEVDA